MKAISTTSCNNIPRLAVDRLLNSTMCSERNAHCAGINIETQSGTSLDDSEAAAICAFRKMCAEAGLLQRPPELGEEDVLDGINDEVTLLYVSSERPMNSSALNTLPGDFCVLTNTTSNERFNGTPTHVELVIM
jgi:hypothetical protein